MSPIITSRKPIAPASPTAHITPYAAILRDKRRSSGALSSIAEWLAVIQGVYYALTGLWPLVSISSFMAVTGPKTDLWLVKVVGILVLAIGVVFITAAVRQALSFEIGLLMIMTSLGLGSLEVIYVLNGTIPPIFLADAIEEFAVCALALLFLPHFAHRRHSHFI